MKCLKYKVVITMEIQITELAAAKLRLLLWKETIDLPLAVRIVLLTSGCNTPSFGLEVIEQQNNQKQIKLRNIPFVWYTEDEQWLEGISIDINRENGKFVIEHPDPSQLTNCPMEPQGADLHQDE
jgi:Fe-S cluster assembly iron-binding protein IscA